MTKRMLIDATHPEETRVAVVSGNKLEEYDYETIVRKQLKGNIYLVKVTRVEPSLQAAFVDFGGNRHGFLPFPEIHPDYYRIPIADREALLAEERALAAEQAAREDAEDAAELAASGESIEETPGEDAAAKEDNEGETAGEEEYVPRHTGSLAADIGQEAVTDASDAEEEDEDTEEEPAAEVHAEGETAPTADAPEQDSDVESVGGDVVETPVYRSSIKRRYKIQEVIKRNQIMLIQISKEERGNKGAAVTSYISLPGRYCVLMPNSPRGGGVSRKVSNAKDRQRLKKILHELNVPEGMSVILRTAGVARNLAEIKRDLDYLLRLWDQIRELTLKSTAPALIYEEGNLIKRAIRDLYRRDIDEVHVSGEEGFKGAQEFMRMLMPSHVARVQQYQDATIPLFFRYQVESQIDEIHSPTVHLKSGGYIVINPTEAMVSIDVNSGRATKGRHIEETALKTNIEAAEEIARQLRLRDQGGLIVIDFIDMEDKRGNRTVERKLRDAMQHDRARIQLGRISAFGLLELSRQRLHPSLVETNFETCKHCAGVGLTRTVETSAVIVLRALEEEGMRAKASEIKVMVPTEIALYLFNTKRNMLIDIEKRYNVRVFINADDSLIKPNYTLEAIKAGAVLRDQKPQRQAPVQSVDISDLPEVSEDEITSDSTYADDEIAAGGDEGGGNRFVESGNGNGERGGRGGDRGGRGRNRGDRGGRGGGQQHHQRADHGGGEKPSEGGEGSGDGGKRRGRRGGRRRGGRNRGGGRFGRPEGGQPQQGQGQPFDAGQQQAPAGDDDNRGNRREEHHNQGGNGHGRHEHHHQPHHHESMPAAASGGEGGDAGGNRKGWWKRLTE